MPQMASITTKKDDGTTDVTYQAVVASSGDKNPAIWRDYSVGTAPTHRPQFTLQSQSNGTKTARRVQGQYMYPALATGTDGKVNVVDRFLLDINAVIPQGMKDTDVLEAVAQSTGLIASELIRNSLSDGYAPT